MGVNCLSIRSSLVREGRRIGRGGAFLDSGQKQGDEKQSQAKQNIAEARGRDGADPKNEPKEGLEFPGDLN